SDNLNSIRRVAIDTVVSLTHAKVGDRVLSVRAFLNDRAIEVSPPLALGFLVNSYHSTDSHQPATDARLAEAVRLPRFSNFTFFSLRVVSRHGCGLYHGMPDSRSLCYGAIVLCCGMQFFVVSNRFVCHGYFIKRVYRTSFGGKALSRRK